MMHGKVNSHTAIYNYNYILSYCYGNQHNLQDNKQRGGSNKMYTCSTILYIFTDCIYYVLPVLILLVNCVGYMYACRHLAIVTVRRFCMSLQLL